MEDNPPSTGILRSALSDLNENVSSCCFDIFETKNKVIPTLVQHPGDFDFIEISPQRRLRIINIKPFKDVETEVGQTVGSEEELSEEEYWFENAAPNRLPVIQPQPQPQQSRVINKFEPREPPSVSCAATPKHVNHNYISPGRLPRKSLKTLDLETDDFEDDETVRTCTGEDSSPQPPVREERTSTNSLSMTGLEHISEILLEITAEGTLAKGCSSSASPPPPSSEDSCHPSPEIPHRAVSDRPDPALGQDNVDAAVVVTGGNLGGVANKGFQDEEEQEEDQTDGEVVEATNPAVTEQAEVDCGYSRERDIERHMESANVGEIGENANISDDHVTPASAGEDKTTSSKTPILFFLHGVGGSADIWSSQISYFVSQGYQVVAPDMLGHGFSSCPDKAKAYTFSKLFRDILSVFDAYIPQDEKCVVFGHSYGCSFTIALARARMERITTLVLVASGGPTPLAPPPVISRYPKCVMDLVRRIMECKFNNHQHKYSPRGKTIKFKEAFDVPGYVFRHVVAGQLWPEGDAGFHRRVTVPTLLVYGMRDDLVSLVEECEMERTLPKAYLELIPTAGHHVMLDTPHQLNLMASKFIKKWNSSK